MTLGGALGMEPVPMDQRLLFYFDMLLFIVIQLTDEIPKLPFREVGLHFIEYGGCKDNPLRIIGYPMVKNTEPWAAAIVHIERHLSVITDIAVFANILPNRFTDFR